MATFYANPDEESELWIERPAMGTPFRIWHYIFFCFSAFVVIVVLMCCCVRIRIPRTKQEIEADYRRKRLAEKFRQRLRLIQNQDMDAIDLERALKIIQEDYRSESKSCQYIPTAPDPEKSEKNFESRAQPQQPFRKVSNVMKFLQQSTN